MNTPALREEYRTSLVRGVATGLLQFGVTTLTVYSTVGEWEAALVAGGIGGLVAVGAFFGLGVHDAQRNDAAAKANP
jgi:hypothetical protein